MSLDGIRSILGRPGAVAAAQGSQETVVIAGDGMDAPEPGVALHGLGTRRNLPGKSRSQSFEHHVNQAGLDFPSPDHRGRRLAMDHATGRSHHPQQAVEAVVDRQVRIDQRFEHVGAGRIGLSVGGIDRRPSLGVGAGEIESNLPGAVKADPGGQTHRAVGEAVAVHHALGAEFTLGKLGHFRSRPPLGVFEKFFDIVSDRFQSQPLDQGAQPASPGTVGGHLGPKVAAGLVLGADLSQDQSKDILHQLPRSPPL